MRRITLLLIFAASAQSAVVTFDWLSGFNGPSARARDITVGDVLDFGWSGNHNVYKMASKDAFDNCNFTGGTNLGETTGVRVDAP